MVKGSITIRNREFKTTIYDGRTYIEPKLTGTVIGTVVHVSETDEGWELLLLQESYHMIGFWVTVSKDEVKKYNLDEPEVNDPLRIDTLYRNSLDKDGVPYMIISMEYADDFYFDRTFFADHCPIL